jgi:protein-tyrosine-phosphatase
LHWPFPDPSKVEGTGEEKLEKVRQIRDAIQARVEQFCAENCARLS